MTAHLVGKNVEESACYMWNAAPIRSADSVSPLKHAWQWETSPTRSWLHSMRLRWDERVSTSSQIVCRHVISLGLVPDCALSTKVKYITDWWELMMDITTLVKVEKIKCESEIPQHPSPFTFMRRYESWMWR
jgi:hypothetical protein